MSINTKTIVCGLLTGVILLCAVLPAATAGQADAEKAFADGNALLQRGDFEGALNAYTTAAREDRKVFEDKLAKHDALIDELIARMPAAPPASGEGE